MTLRNVMNTFSLSCAHPIYDAADYDYYCYCFFPPTLLFQGRSLRQATTRIMPINAFLPPSHSAEKALKKKGEESQTEKEVGISKITRQRGGGAGEGKETTSSRKRFIAHYPSIITRFYVFFANLFLSPSLLFSSQKCSRRRSMSAFRGRRKENFVISFCGFCVYCTCTSKLANFFR